MIYQLTDFHFIASQIGFIYYTLKLGMLLYKGARTVNFEKCRKKSMSNVMQNVYGISEKVAMTWKSGMCIFHRGQKVKNFTV